MTKIKKVLAIIPARGGSKRLPRKNVLSLAGKPLIAWTIEAAINSQIFDEIVVSTDDKEIAETSTIYGAKVPFIRPVNLACDTAKSIDVIKHTLEWFQDNNIYFTDVVLLQPTSPLRNEEDIKCAYNLYNLRGASSVISVCEVDHPSAWANRLDESLSMDNFVKKLEKRSQGLDREYRLNGAIYIWKVEKLLEQSSTIIMPSFASIMPRSRSIDIDEEIDFKIAQAIMT